MQRHGLLILDKGVYPSTPLVNSTEIAEGIGQLDIHLGQRLLYVLDGPSRLFHVPGTQAPDGSHAFHLFGQMERVAQKPVSVELTTGAEMTVSLVQDKLTMPSRSWPSHWHSCTSLL